jgi:broad specificity phosphatase PhoE
MEERLALVSRDGRRHTDGLSAPLYKREFDRVLPFSEGLSAVIDGGSAYHIGYDGEPVYDARFLETYSFSEGLAAVRDRTGWFHIRKDGSPAYPERYGWCGNFREGMCAVRRKDGRYSFLDSQFRIIGDYRWAGDFSEGYAPVISDEGAYHVRKDGSPMCQTSYIECRGFHEGKAPVRDQKGWFRIDASGKPVDTERYDSITYKGTGEWRVVRGKDVFLLTDRGNAYLMRLPEKSSSTYSHELWWFSDISSRKWDSCVLVIRHSARDRFSRSDFQVHYPGLNSKGEELARAAGRAIKKALKGRLEVYSSPVQRCMETAAYISDECNGPEPVPSHVLGNPGTPFVSDESVIDETWEKYPVSEITFGDLAGGTTSGLHPPEVNARLLTEALRPQLAHDKLLTVCVTHDLYLMRVVGYLAGRYPDDTWADFCEGFMLIRRGGKEYFVWQGREYPLPEEFPRKNLDLTPVWKKKELPAESGDHDLGGGLKFSDGFIVDSSGKKVGGPYAWAGRAENGIVPFRREDGSCGHVREDGVKPYRFRFDDADPFSNTAAPVWRDGLGCTFISDAGELLIDDWHIECRPYSEGYAAVRDADGWYHVDAYGKPLYPERYEEAGDFRNGEALCRKEKEFIIVSNNGEKKLFLDS